MLLRLAALLALVLLAGCGSDGDDGEAEAQTTPTPAATATPTPEAAAGCEPVDRPKPKPGEADKPTEELDPETTYVAVIETNCGTFSIELDVERAPKTAASFAALARDGFYDGTIFHRIATGFVIQGGDPEGSGMGGPGYQVVEPPPQDVQYGPGVVAMAKAPDEPAGASGSQFFVVLTDGVALPPEYALLGEVTSGFDVVTTIGTVATDPTTEQPLEPVVMESVAIEER